MKTQYVLIDHENVQPKDLVLLRAEIVRFADDSTRIVSDPYDRTPNRRAS